MTTIPKLARRFQDVLTTTAEAAAVASGFVRRRPKLTGARVVQTLVLGWMETPGAGGQQLSRLAGVLGVSISP